MRRLTTALTIVVASGLLAFGAVPGEHVNLPTKHRFVVVDDPKKPVVVSLSLPANYWRLADHFPDYDGGILSGALGGGEGGTFMLVQSVDYHVQGGSLFIYVEPLPAAVGRERPRDRLRRAVEAAVKPDALQELLVETENAYRGGLIGPRERKVEIGSKRFAAFEYSIKVERLHLPEAIATRMTVVSCAIRDQMLTVAIDHGGGRSILLDDVLAYLRLEKSAAVEVPSEERMKILDFSGGIFRYVTAELPKGTVDVAPQPDERELQDYREKRDKRGALEYSIEVSIVMFDPDAVLVEEVTAVLDDLPEGATVVEAATAKTINGNEVVLSAYTSGPDEPRRLFRDASILVLDTLITIRFAVPTGGDERAVTARRRVAEKAFAAFLESMYAWHGLVK